VLYEPNTEVFSSAIIAKNNSGGNSLDRAIPFRDEKAPHMLRCCSIDSLHRTG
jgi:hypothetical protein